MSWVIPVGQDGQNSDCDQRHGDQYAKRAAFAEFFV
jgi:hypothetical protein